jgi:uncharacterized protein
MLITRRITAKLNQLSKEYRSITINGPRQSGKTTLIKTNYPSYKYVNMEDPDSRQAAISDPRQFLAKYTKQTIIDEVQQTPDILSYLQGILDNDPDKAQYILSGSQNFILSEKVSQTLVGRTALLTLLPLSLAEIRTVSPDSEIEDIILKGGYPALYTDNYTPEDFYRSYINLYLERDVRTLRSVSNLTNFERFITLIAGRVGQLVNFTEISSDLGVDAKTIADWMTILETSFITFRLPPYYKNIKTRTVKAPKVYFHDTGLLCTLLQINNTTDLLNSPFWGNIYENFVVSEYLKSVHNQGKRPEMYFVRNKQGREIDLLTHDERGWTASEIKSSMTFNAKFGHNLNYYTDLLGEVLHKQVIYRGQTITNMDIDYTNTNDLSWIK